VSRTRQAYRIGSSHGFIRNATTRRGGGSSAHQDRVPRHNTTSHRCERLLQLFRGGCGPVGKGYYSLRPGTWHIVAMNSNIAMKRGLAAEVCSGRSLAKSTKRCTVAYWHHPLFSSGNEGGLTPRWRRCGRTCTTPGRSWSYVGTTTTTKRSPAGDERRGGLACTASGSSSPARGRRSVQRSRSGGELGALNDNTNGVLKADAAHDA